MPENSQQRAKRLRDVRPVGAAYFGCALAAAVAAVWTSISPVSGYQLGQTILLTAVAMLHAEAARNVERIRRRQKAVAHVDLNSTWTFAAALVLPLPLAAAMIVVIYLHVWLRVQRTPTFQRVFNVAMYILATAAAQAVFGLAGPGALATIPGAVTALVAAAAYSAVNVGLLTAWLATARLADRPFKTGLGTPADNALEAVTLCLAVFVAMAMHYNALLVLIGLPLILVLHRNELIHQLEELARRDTKTGLLNATAWTDLARERLAAATRRGEVVGVLLMDLDLFKKVNDTYGHLAGDEVLRDAAESFQHGVRSMDAVGRFGGEEFVVLLPETTIGQMMLIAERIRRGIEQLVVRPRIGDDQQTIDGLSVSIGAAAFPTQGQDLDQLLDAADKALYQAKRNGRNRTRLAPRLVP
ncbi:GGDEF domain-containing protein [Actinocrispum wychmicini]|uniref:Diguanylate cyclase (GGDEF)-like protein n=1 Tax=Actinocrispum wychmicini TaxID=1213861 RepID=A0A4R2J9R3_9PSEU|nr:GGDEF domain-containing protein [Actinocrispum wychmicini]TCO52659.1 diguanylate cyclase (GGDEF)-like protein [Actinocrispum wychmicini]